MTAFFLLGILWLGLFMLAASVSPFLRREDIRGHIHTQNTDHSVDRAGELSLVGDSEKDASDSELAPLWKTWQHWDHDIFQNKITRDGNDSASNAIPPDQNQCSTWSFDPIELTIIYHRIPQIRWAGSIYKEPEHCQKQAEAAGREIPDPGWVHRRFYEETGEYFFEEGMCPSSPEKGCQRPPRTCLGHKKVSIGQCCRQRGVKMLHILAQELKRRQVSWFLDAGSMLGALRNKGFIRYDYDIDIQVAWEHRQRFYNALGVTQMKTGAYIVVDAWTPRQTASMVALHGMRIEFWFWKNRSGKLSVYSTAVKSKEESEVFPVKYVDFDGMLMPVPKDAEALMRKEYGPKYMEEVKCDKGKPSPTLTASKNKILQSLVNRVKKTLTVAQQHAVQARASAAGGGKP